MRVLQTSGSYTHLKGAHLKIPRQLNFELIYGTGVRTFIIASLHWHRKTHIRRILVDNLYVIPTLDFRIQAHMFYGSETSCIAYALKQLPIWSKRRHVLLWRRQWGIHLTLKLTYWVFRIRLWHKLEMMSYMIRSTAHDMCRPRFMNCLILPISSRPLFTKR